MNTKPTFTQFLIEASVHRDDPEMDDYYDAGPDDEPQEGREGPYAVGWSGQYIEWYGSEEGPESGDGRYKSKGDAGQIVAINVPKYEQAQKISDKLDDKLRQEDMGTMGKDWGVVFYDGTWVRPMKEVPRWEIRHAREFNRNLKDYGDEA